MLVLIDEKMITTINVFCFTQILWWSGLFFIHGQLSASVFIPCMYMFNFNDNSNINIFYNIIFIYVKEYEYKKMLFAHKCVCMRETWSSNGFAGSNNKYFLSRVYHGFVYQLHVYATRAQIKRKCNLLFFAPIGWYEAMYLDDTWTK